MYEGKYYLIEITKYVDNTPDSKAIYSYDTENDAIASFHKKMGGARTNVNYAFELTLVINEYGVPIRTETFERAINDLENITEE